MKKIFIALLCFLTFPLFASAANYDIKHYYINATLEDNGDMSVEELIVMKGTFNGYEVGIEYNTNDYYSASSMEDIKIFGNTNIDEEDIDIKNWKFVYPEFEKVGYANNGDILKYIETIGIDSNNYRMYYATNNSKTAFLFKYTLKNVAISHADCVEYYWNFFSNSFRDNINDLKIRINYPTKMNEEDFHWWFHGNLAGTSEIVNVSDNYTTVIASLDYLSAYSPVDFRTLAPKEGFKTSTFRKMDNEEVKRDIINHENDIVRQDLETIKRNKILFYTFETLSVIYIISLIIIWIYVYKKFDKERTPKFQHKYNRDFIDDYNVEVVDFLMNNQITPNAMSASILNMIYKKNIETEKDSSDDKNYIFTLKTRDNLNDTENILVDFLFEKVGTANTFTTKELKRYASSTKTCDIFMNSYTKWKNKVMEDGKNQGFYDTLEGRFTYGAVMLIIALLIYVAGVCLFHVNFLLIHLLLPASFIFIIYLGFIKRKSEKGIEHYAMWKAFKNFLNDFGAFSTKELPEVILWERYLVYATIFGLAKKVQKDMNVKIKEMDISEFNNKNTYIFLNNYNFVPLLNDSVRQAYNGAQTTINREAANASGGSFGGHGGGFSSGGGFGGGGRSGGGF